jgi:hypothetical protein
MPDCKGNCNGGCNGGCSKPRKTCGNPNPCEEQECGCQIELSASCVRVREDYPCIGVNRNETIVLMRDVLPYFESVEDYEKCAEIKNLYEELTNSKKLVTI